MENKIAMTPRYTIFLNMFELAQDLFGADRVTDSDIDTNNLPIVRVEEGMNTKNANKDMIGTVNMVVNLFSTTDFAQRARLEVMLAELHNALALGELPINDSYDVKVARVEEPAPRRDDSTGQTLLQKTLLIRLTYTKKIVNVVPVEPVPVFATIDPIEVGSLLVSGTGTPKEKILIFISGDSVVTGTVRIGEDGTYSYGQAYGIKGGDVVKVLRLSDGRELASYVVPAEDTGDGGGGMVEPPEEDFYTSNVSEGISLRGYRGKSLDIRIPLSVNGRPVVELLRTFDGLPIRSVEIPDSVVRIRSQAFRYCGLVDVKLPANLREISTRYAFAYNNLSSLIIPEGVETIGDYAFQYNIIDTLVLPSSLKTVGFMAFGRNALREVVIPDGVESIGGYAFANNYLERVVIPPSVTSIGDWAFDSDVEIVEEELIQPQMFTTFAIQPYNTFNDPVEKEIPDNSHIKIEGYRGTEAERYAIANGYTFIELD